MQDLEFYQGHLDRVSRSFAFCIRKLQEPMRPWVSLSYLLCRVLDTVEDCLWEDREIQAAQYEALERFLDQAPAPSEMAAWVERFPASVPATERALLRDAGLLFADLHGLPPKVRSEIRDVVQRMGKGMQRYSSQADLKLRDLQDVNLYCYFVAGVVGELLSRLFVCYRPDFRPDPDFLKNAFHFGLFLQKVNLLKDQRGDEREGRFLVPDRLQVRDSLRGHARASLRYITSLPRNELGYRTFCAWSLFLGLGSLPFIQESFVENNAAKISREQTQALLAEIEAIAGDDEALRAHGERCLALLPEGPLAASGRAADARDNRWFHRISGGVLSPDELAEIGISA